LRIARVPQTSIRRYWWQAAIATTFILVAPPLSVMWLERAGFIEHPLLSVVAGVAGSMLAASAGTALWMRAGTNDIAFSDLLLWGYLRRLVMEKRIMNSAKLLNHRAASDDDSEIRNLQRLAAALEAADPYTHGHSRRVARISCMIAKEMGLPKKRIQLLRIAAAVHDVGKLFVPSPIINKPGKLTPEEFELVKQHSTKGADLVMRLSNPDLTAIVRHHHERMDGRGYPDGLAGPSIPLGARIIAVADAFDAMTSNRSYRKPANHKAALESLRGAAGTQFDSGAVNAFVNYYRGKRALTRWALIASAPHRWLGELAGSLQGAAAGVKGTVAAAGSAALLTGTVLTGTAVAPAVTKHLPSLQRLTVASGIAEDAGAGRAADGPGELPRGLARMKHLPPGLAKMDRLPVGLRKSVADGKNEHLRGGRARKAAEPAGPAQEAPPRPQVQDHARAARKSKDSAVGAGERKSPAAHPNSPVAPAKPEREPKARKN
jgi:hypothetical protein